jgi:hypothetical protein
MGFLLVIAPLRAFPFLCSKPPDPRLNRGRSPDRRLPVEVPGELRTLALAQAPERRAGRDPAAV